MQGHRSKKGVLKMAMDGRYIYIYTCTLSVIFICCMLHIMFTLSKQAPLRFELVSETCHLTARAVDIFQECFRMYTLQLH